MMWSNEYIAQWRLVQRTYLGDTNVVAHDTEVDLRRTQAQHEMLQLLHSFLDGAITLRKLNAVFQQSTHTRWNDFHVRGMSGGLFLNKLVKYIPNEETFAHLLRMILRLPEDERDGQRQMQAFVRFLEGLIASQQVQRSHLQPARVPFFLSFWWHVQVPEHWPIFYLDLRKVLLTGDETAGPGRDYIHDYFTFRARFLSLLQGLSVSPWELEHLCTWYGQRSPRSITPDDEHTPSDSQTHRPLAYVDRQTGSMERLVEGEKKALTAIGGNMDTSRKEKHVTAMHTQLQWLLAKIGHKVGCQVWIDSRDHDKVWKNERLGNLSLEALPVLEDSHFQQVIRHIDVLWLLKQDVVAAYEIVHTTTDMSADLLRLFDLAALFPKRQVQLYVVSPRHRFEHVQFELSRPLFHDYDLRKRCAIVHEEMLLQQAEHILRWASSPVVMKDLINPHGNAV